jgi:site-specific recombinase XerD
MTTAITLDQKTVAALTLDGCKNKKGDKKGEPSTDWIFFDADLHGFGIRVRYDRDNKLCKTWCVQYRVDDGRRQRRQGLGKFPRVNAAAARTKAGAWLDKVEEGTDPAITRAADRKAEALKFHHAVGMYLAKQQTEVRDSTFENIKGYLTKPKYFGTLHAKPVARVTQSDVEQCLDAIVQKPSRWAAQKCLSAFYAWAVRKGHASENPLVKVEQVKLESRERVLDKPNPHEPLERRDYAEIRAVWNACQDDDLGRIIKLLLLTACRANEIGQLKWSEINLDAGTITLPKERTKNGWEHTLPLSPLALQIIKQVEKRDGRDFLFGKWADGFTSWPKQKNLVEPLGLEHWTVHDLRRSAATHMAELGIQPHIIETILNHVSGHKADIAGTYNRASYARDVRNALAVWADHVEGIVTGRARKVVPLRAWVPCG